MGVKLRVMAPPFVVAPPAGASVRTRLHPSVEDASVLAELGRFLGGLTGSDLAVRCGQGRLDPKGAADSRRERKRTLTSVCSSRWAGTITRTSEDAWQLGWRNLEATAANLQVRIGKIRSQLVLPCGGRQGRSRGYPNQGERFAAQRHLQVLEARLSTIQARLADGRVSVCRGGGGLARQRHQLAAAGRSPEEWREEWEPRRWFLTADGEADKPWGNETIRWHPDDGWLEIKLPAALAHRANRPHGRYRLSAQVSFSYRGEDVAAQAATGAVRYDIVFCWEKHRWYLNASWKTPVRPLVSLAELRRHPVLAVDVNAAHLAAVVVDCSGNPMGAPITVPLELAGCATSTRDGRLRAALSQLLRVAGAAGCQAVVIENLNFEAARTEGTDHHGRRPSRGRQGRAYRRLVAGIPTSRFRHRLAQMGNNRGLAVVAIDPAYTSQWGARYWLDALRCISADATGHHAAALVIGRRGLGQRPRRRERCDWTRPEDRRQRATNSAVRPTPDHPGLPEHQNRKPGTRTARGQPWHQTQPANRHPPGHQVTHDRSGPPVIATSADAGKALTNEER